ncbi:LAME_0H12420g1_1 [Lachancea meyersii CBS 8951]|uniref:Mitochondrial inner membrane protease subunit 2 n=1 Tax=Lachancea meyersii CBS 8951 TaxID=1266667 RepID=A0A1G4KH02_9SACH|nr:LAME_0H12420g1_1 [Lachancea meyersii CBS 8951]
MISNLGKLGLNLRTTLIAVSWIPVALTFNENVCYVAKIEGKSMRPTLNPSDKTHTDWVLMWKWGAKNPANLRHNDVVLFKSPSDPQRVYCKRIKGVQYDTIQTRHPYPRAIVTIPRSHIWTEGDNAFHSTDSNEFGPVSTGLVLGKAVAIVWPPSRWNSSLNQSVGRGDLSIKGSAI